MLCKEPGNSHFDEKRWKTYSVLSICLRAKGQHKVEP